MSYLQEVLGGYFLAILYIIMFPIYLFIFFMIHDLFIIVVVKLESDVAVVWPD